MSPSLLHGSEDPRGPHHVLSTSIAPLDVGGISLLEDADGLSMDDELPVLHLDCAVELAVDGIILEHGDHAAKVNEGVIDGNDVHFARIKSGSGDQAPDAAESIPSDLLHLVSDAVGTARKLGYLSNGQEQRA